MSDRLTTQKTLPDGAQDELKCAAIALDIHWGDVFQNLRETEALVKALPRDTDVAVLPELFTTAFIADPAIMAEKAEENDGPTLSTLKRLAASTGIAIAGSFLCAENGDFMNRGFFVTPSGDVTTYDKRHLFCLSPESKICRGGTEQAPVVNYKGWNIALIICYDLRFPAWCRNQRQRYDILLVPANWPNVRAYAWHHLLIARAIENQAIVIGADRAGADHYGEYDGMTEIYDAMGKPEGEHAVLKPESMPGLECEVVYASNSLSRLRKLRQSLPFGADADQFAFQL